MKKYGFRILVGLVAFVIGVFVVSFFINTTVIDRINREFNNLSLTEVPTSDILITFKEFVPTKYGLTADFEVANNSKSSAYYQAFPSSENENEIYTLRELKVDNLKVVEFQCGTGLIEYELKPGQSKEFRLAGNNLSNFYKEGKNMQIGFNFKFGKVEDYQTFWSDDLPISKSIAFKLFEEQRKLR